MKILIILLLLQIASFGKPAPNSNSVLKPTFMTGFDSFSGGTAFLCKIDQLDTSLILTAHHLFGPACGWEKEFKWNELRPTFEAMTGLSMGDFRRFVTSTELLVIPGAKGLDDKGYDRDIAAWRIPSSSALPTLTAAKKLPPKGDTVYLYARERGKDKLNLFEAKVLVSTAKEFEYVFKQPKINLAGTSGAPVLDGNGKVVAINIGGGEEGGKTIGIGNPIPSILKMLGKALETKP